MFFVCLGVGFQLWFFFSPRLHSSELTTSSTKSCTRSYWIPATIMLRNTVLKIFCFKSPKRSIRGGCCSKLCQSKMKVTLKDFHMVVAQERSYALSLLSPQLPFELHPFTPNMQYDMEFNFHLEWASSCQKSLHSYYQKT